ncbi:tryptophan-rich sensory protein [Sphingobium sufflavum]|uniref:TspO/MBR family protein n=1 Tax=Sphingobium sufflavum TaxID=1129547 RepID=UPI001F1CBA1B|nr:TspO/MBR family protein [Sphingobium sufflavum]MCE7798563.1 tryptophan-rich sensory protein [Sphingobium sufflavum]
MNELASRSQLRMSFLRWALFCVSLILLLGIGSGIVSNSGYGNAWFAALAKPAIMPPGWAFGAAWTILYILLGLALAVVIGARRAPGRGLAITIFIVQIILNFLWSPLFFAAHEVTVAFYLILLILVLSVLTTLLFARVRTAAAVLMLPYLLWLCFAAFLNFAIDQANPHAETLVAPAISTQI